MKPAPDLTAEGGGTATPSGQAFHIEGGSAAGGCRLSARLQRGRERTLSASNPALKIECHGCDEDGEDRSDIAQPAAIHRHCELPAIWVTLDEPTVATHGQPRQFDAICVSSSLAVAFVSCHGCRYVKNPNVLISSDYGPIIINVNDTYISRAVAQVGIWAKEDIEISRQIMDFLYTRKNTLVLYDVGSNIGTFALAFAKIYGEKIRIRAFEAQRQIFNMMCGTIAINGLANVMCHNLAVSDVRGQLLQVAMPDYGAPNNFGGLELVPPRVTDNQNMSVGGHEAVETTTLDAFGEVVDFIKMDIEGMEDAALRGARRVIGEGRPICFVEILKTDVDFVIDYFRGFDYMGIRKGDDLIVSPAEYGLTIRGLPRIF